MAKKTEQPNSALPKAEHRSGPKHPVALGKAKKPPEKKPLKQRLAEDQARKWADVLESLSPDERQHLQAMRQQAEEDTKPRWHLVEIPEGEFPQLHAFMTLDDLVEYLKEVIEAGHGRVFPFYGERMHISHGPLRHLMIGGREPIPLFELPETLLIDETGYVGDPEDEPEGLSFENPRTAAMEAGDVNDGLDDVGGEAGPGPGWSDEEDPAEDDELDQPPD